MAKKKGAKVKKAAKKLMAVAKKAVRKAAAKLTGKKKKAGPGPVAGSVVHVEFYTPDLEGAKAFWSELVGWQFHPFQPGEYYFHSPSAWGPGGCAMQGQASMHAATLYVQVDDIPATLDRAQGLGATVLRQKTEIPGGHGFYGHIKAPDGNVFGVWAKS